MERTLTTRIGIHRALSDQAGRANGGIGLLLEVVGYQSWGGTLSHGGGAVEARWRMVARHKKGRWQAAP
jgi:hypothetical protein